mgnify:CR=1 FL=1
MKENNIVLKKFYTPEEIMEILNLSRTSVYKLFKRSDFPAVRIGRMLRVEQSKFEKWLEASSVSAEKEEELPF